MKKKKNNKQKVPAYAFGLNGIEDYAAIADLLGTGIQGVSDENSGASIAGGAIGGAAKGASAGMAAGPIGAVAGGVLGLAGGLFTGFKRKKAMEKAQRVKQNGIEIAMGKNNAATMMQQYGEENPLAYTFENGGVLPDLAYLDNNEVIRDDAGNIQQVPNSKPGTDNHLVDASTLDSVLSDKLKRPGTNKTFAQEGEKLVKMAKGSKGKDRFARTADQLNKANANRMYEQLLNEQEAVKTAKGVKPKTKGIPAYQDGKSKLSNTIRGIQSAGMLGSPYRDVEPYSPVYKTVNPFIDGPSLTESMVQLPEVVVTAPRKTAQAKPSTAQQNRSFKQAPLINIENEQDPELSSAPWLAPMLNLETIEDPELSPVIPASSNKRNRSLSSSLSGLSPILYNFMQSLRNPEVETTVNNPYAGAVNRAMSSRRINIEPTLAANRRARSINRNNIARINPNTGMNLAYGNAIASSEYAQNADVYANRDNANNAYLGEYANMMNNLGQQFVQSQTLTNDLNARNREASRNYASTAVGQLGQWSQTKEQMRNQARRDDMLLPFLGNFLEYGQTKETMKDFYNRFYGR